MTVAEVFMRGNMVIVRAPFYVPDEDGDLEDPDTVVFTARKERAAEADAFTYGDDVEVTRVEQGIYELSFVPEFGGWNVHVQGTGAAYASDEISFKISRSLAIDGL